MWLRHSCNKVIHEHTTSKPIIEILWGTVTKCHLVGNALIMSIRYWRYLHQLLTINRTALPITKLKKKLTFVRSCGRYLIAQKQSLVPSSLSFFSVALPTFLLRPGSFGLPFLSLEIRTVPLPVNIYSLLKWKKSISNYLATRKCKVNDIF